MHVAEDRNLRDAAGNERSMVGRRAERANLAGVPDAVAEVRLRVRDDERVAGARRVAREDREPGAVPPGLAPDRAVRLARTRHVHDPGDGLVAAQDADADAPRRQSGDERRGAVDRVEDDPVRPPAVVHRPLLAQDARLRQARPERRDEECLDLAVRRGDERPVRLPLARDVAEMAEGQVPRIDGDRLELRTCGQLHRPHDSTPGRGWPSGEEPAQHAEVSPVVAMVVGIGRLRRLETHRKVAKARIAQQAPERRAPEVAAADVLVPIDA